MSSIKAKVSHIECCGNLCFVKFDVCEQNLSMVSLELNPKIKVGVEVVLLIKPSHVAIAKNLSGDLSYSNQIKVTIDDVQNGEILSSLKLRCQDKIFESFITSSSSKRMDLQVGDEVVALIKASEISIGEILDV